MNKTQELFNKMWVGLEAQGWLQSVNAGGGCEYFAEDGKKCAVGHCLSKDPEFFGPVERLVESMPLLSAELGLNDGVGMFFLQDAQRAHDNAANPEDMKSAFVRLADDYGLEVPE